MLEMKTAIYMSVTSWKNELNKAMSLPEQTRICRQYMRLHPELRKVGTYTDRNTVRDSTKELDRLLVELENRRVECVVTASAYQFFESGEALSFYLKQVMIPAGFRLIAIQEEIDTNAPGWEKKFNGCLKKRRKV